MEMSKLEKVIRGLRDIDMFIAGRLEHEKAKNFLRTIDETIALLKEQESFEQKTGHWIWLQYCANEGVYCSECHTKMFDRYPMKKKLSQFCGHCGAKMGDEVGK